MVYDEREKRFVNTIFIFLQTAPCVSLRKELYYEKIFFIC